MKDLRYKRVFGWGLVFGASLLAVRYVGYVLSVMSQMGSISHSAPAAPFELGTRELADIQQLGGKRATKGGEDGYGDREV